MLGADAPVGGGPAAPRQVADQVGIADDTYQEIVSGLSPGDEVVTGPDRVLRALEDGDRISVAEGKRENRGSAASAAISLD